MRHNLRDNSSRDYFGNGATGVTLTRENWGVTLDNVFTVEDPQINTDLTIRAYKTDCQRRLFV